MVVIDTNILAYLLISGDRTQEAQTLFVRDSDWKSEAFLLVEFSNMLATYERQGRLSRARSEEVFLEAEARMHGLVNLPHVTALRTAHRFAVSAYDARFLATAETFNAKLVTEDVRLRTAAPALTQSMADVLAAD